MKPSQTLHKIHLKGFREQGPKIPPKTLPKRASPCELSDIPPPLPPLSPLEQRNCPLPAWESWRPLLEPAADPLRPQSRRQTRWLDQSESSSGMARPIRDQLAFGDNVCPLSITLLEHLHFILIMTCPHWLIKHPLIANCFYPTSRRRNFTQIWIGQIHQSLIY